MINNQRRCENQRPDGGQSFAGDNTARRSISGYGNIVPVTPYGRIACVVFALFGAPLTIITVGDLGKFLSECTIWLYSKMRKHYRALRNHVAEFKSKVTGNAFFKRLSSQDYFALYLCFSTIIGSHNFRRELEVSIQVAGCESWLVINL